ncbi:hypothetical protein DXG03_006818 [Asterophora parasitica]|uniref:Uncharacterized protein n=1 Tax=Asterophora parasitica TaxID=117018 RepID=A0A9P7FZE0_9AGAR|nr:hypothetical protein DXG03_006818 [Asterophora parasitica]
MDTRFAFPRPQAPTPRPAPASPVSPAGGANRESNALRASILDAALILGIGNNNLVSDWMFSNSLAEEDEDDQRSPALTYGSTDESSFSGGIGRYPSTSSSSHTSSNHAPRNPKSAQAPDASLFAVPESHVYLEKSVDNITARQPPRSDVPFPDIPIPQQPVTPIHGKLRKKKRDGYESDGGYMSDAGKKKDKEKKKSAAKDDTNKKERKEAKTRAKEEKLQEKREKEEERKRKKSLGKVKKGQDEDKDGYATGYETDASKSAKSLKKSKSNTSGNAGYEADLDHLSSTPGRKSKGRFFKLGSKQSKPDLRPDEVLALPAAYVTVPLPIASRFATSAGTAPLGAGASLANTTTINPSSVPPIPQVAIAPPPMPSSTTPPLQSPAFSTRNAPGHRESRGSAESAMLASSSASHSRGFQVFGQQRQDHGHGQGSSSYSIAMLPAQATLPPSVVSSPISLTTTFPPISLPLTHTPSTSSPQGGYPPLPPLQQPSPISTASSPPQALTPSLPVSRPPPSSPGLNVPGPQDLQTTSPSTSSTKAGTPALRVRPRFPPTDGFGPRPSPLSPLPPTPSSFLRSPRPDSMGIRKPSTRHADHSHPTSIPSPRASPLTSPNVLAYYDIPPPSPPPPGPLPSVPPPSSFGRTPTQSGGGSINSIQVARSRTPIQGISNPRIQRGREAPFPARPILPSPASTTVGGGVGPGLEEHVKVPRYRELYGLPLPPHDPERGWRSTPSPTLGWDEADYDEEHEEDMRDVLDSFCGRDGGKALGRSRSFEAIHNRIAGVDDSDLEYYDKDSHGGDDVGRKSSTEEEGADGNSRWSGSIYSRVSVLCPEKSEETRQRFIDRIEAIYGGRDSVPPIPKLPEAFVDAGSPTPGRSRNRF